MTRSASTTEKRTGAEIRAWPEGSLGPGVLPPAAGLLLGAVVGSTLALAAAGPQLELRGRVEPPQRAAVALYGAVTPFHRRTFSDPKGRFEFKKVPAGSYTVAVFHPRLGESRTTVDVTPSFADERGVVEVRIRLAAGEAAGERALVNRTTVEARDLRVSPKAVSLLRKAQRKLGKGRAEAAIRDLERAVKISEGFVEAWNLMGTVFYQRAEYPRAEESFRTALALDEDGFEPIVNLGGTLLSMKRPADALPFNTRAVSARPESALANSQMGINYFLLEKDTEALRYLNKAKSLDPSHFSHPQLILAQIHVRHRRPETALRELEDFLDRHPDSPLRAAAQAGIKRLSRSLPSETP